MTLGYTANHQDHSKAPFTLVFELRARTSEFLGVWCLELTRFHPKLKIVQTRVNRNAHNEKLRG